MDNADELLELFVAVHPQYAGAEVTYRDGGAGPADRLLALLRLHLACQGCPQPIAARLLAPCADKGVFRAALIVICSLQSPLARDFAEGLAACEREELAGATSALGDMIEDGGLMQCLAAGSAPLELFRRMREAEEYTDEVADELAGLANDKRALEEQVRALGAADRTLRAEHQKTLVRLQQARDAAMEADQLRASQQALEKDAEQARQTAQKLRKELDYGFATQAALQARIDALEDAQRKAAAASATGPSPSELALEASLHTEVHSLQSDNRLKDTRLQILSAKVESMRGERDAVNEHLVETQNECDQLRVEVESLAQQLSTLATQTASTSNNAASNKYPDLDDSMEAACDPVPASPEAGSVAVDMELQRLRQENAALQRKLEVYQSLTPASARKAKPARAASVLESPLARDLLQGSARYHSQPPSTEGSVASSKRRHRRTRRPRMTDMLRRIEEERIRWREFEQMA